MTLAAWERSGVVCGCGGDWASIGGAEGIWRDAAGVGVRLNVVLCGGDAGVGVCGR